MIFFSHIPHASGLMLPPIKCKILIRDIVVLHEGFVFTKGVVDLGRCGQVFGCNSSF